VSRALIGSTIIFYEGKKEETPRKLKIFKEKINEGQLRTSKKKEKNF
jgi:hypothetical protein